MHWNRSQLWKKLVGFCLFVKEKIEKIKKVVAITEEKCYYG